MPVKEAPSIVGEAISTGKIPNVKPKQKSIKKKSKTDKVKKVMKKKSYKKDKK